MMEDAKSQQNEFQESYSTKEEMDAARDDSKIVKVLTTENFDQEVKATPLMFIHFYDVDDIMATALVFDWNITARHLLKDKPPVIAAKIDAKAHQSITDRFEIIHFPAFIMFNHGDWTWMPNQGMDAKSLIKYARGKAKKSSEYIECDAIDAKLEETQ